MQHVDKLIDCLARGLPQITVILIISYLGRYIDIKQLTKSS